MIQESKDEFKVGKNERKNTYKESLNTKQSYNSISQLLNDPNLIPISIKTKKDDEAPPVLNTFIPTVIFDSFNEYINTQGELIDKNRINNLKFKKRHEEKSPKFHKKEAKEELELPDCFYQDLFSLKEKIIENILSLDGEELGEPLEILISKVFQSQLSQKIDIIETEIVNEISKKSSSFFLAINILKELKSELVLSHQLIENCKLEIQNSSKHLKSSLFSLKLNNRLDKLKQCRFLLNIIKELKIANSIVENKLNFEGSIPALNTILRIIHVFDTDSFLVGFNYKSNFILNKSILINKGKDQLLETFTNGHPNLKDIFLNIIKTSDIVKTLITNLNLIFHKIIKNEEEIFLSYLSKSVQEVFLHGSFNNKITNESMVPNTIVKFLNTDRISDQDFSLAINCLLKTNELKYSLIKFKNAFEDHIDIVFEKLFDSQLNQEQLAKGQVYNLKIDEYSLYLSSCFKILVLLFHKFSLISQIIKDNIERFSFTSIIESPESNYQDIYKSKANHDSNDILNTIYESIQLKAGEIFVNRKDKNIKLSMEEYFRLTEPSLKLIELSESYFDTPMIKFRDIVANQSRLFLTKFHGEKSKQLVQAIEIEQWISAEIPFEYQIIVESILQFMNNINSHLESHNIDKKFEGSTSIKSLPDLESIFSISTRRNSTIALTPGIFKSKSETNNLEVYSELTSQDNYNILSPNFEKVSIQNVRSLNENKETLNHIKVLEKSFFVVNCTLLLIKLIHNYLELGKNVVLLNFEIKIELLSLINTFNEKLTLTVLGAHAIKTAGLKSITAKHITLASQSLSFVISLLQSSQNFFKDVSSNEIENQLSSTLRSLEEHRDNLLNKLISIMSERSKMHISKMQSQSWLHEFNDKEPQINDYMLALVKEIDTLNKVITKYGNEEDNKIIIFRIVDLYTLKFKEIIPNLKLKTPDSKLSLLTDIQHFLSLIKGFPLNGISQHDLEVVVNEIEIDLTVDSSLLLN